MAPFYSDQLSTGIACRNFVLVPGRGRRKGLVRVAYLDAMALDSLGCVASGRSFAQGNVLKELMRDSIDTRIFERSPMPRAERMVACWDGTADVVVAELSFWRTVTSIVFLGIAQHTQVLGYGFRSTPPYRKVTRTWSCNMISQAPSAPEVFRFFLQ